MTDQQSEFEQACLTVLNRAYTAFRPTERLSDEALARLADEWSRLIGTDIPADRLETVYDQWVKNERPRYFPRPQDLLPVWEQMHEDAAAETRNEQRQLSRWDGTQWLYSCLHCEDQGWQFVWQFAGRWTSTARPCCCKAASPGQRNSKPLDVERYSRHHVRVGTGWQPGLLEWASRADLLKHGAPCEHWQAMVNTLQQSVAKAA